MKFKKQISLILAAAMTLGSVNIAFADTENIVNDAVYEQEEEDIVVPMSKSNTDVAYPVEGGNIYFDKSTGTVTDVDNDIISADIPAEIEGVAVKAIGEGVFYDCKVKSITIPDGVTSIGKYAFNRCSELVSIKLPEGITSMENDMFRSDLKLSKISIPASVTDIGEETLSNCGALTEITVPDSNKNYTAVDSVLFNKDKSVILCYPRLKSGEEYTIPDSVTSIGSYAFCVCENLKSITIPDSVKSIGNEAFSSCTNLDNLILPDSVTSIGEGAFFLCEKLSEIKLPDNLISIGNNAFGGCNSLKK